MKWTLSGSFSSDEESTCQMRVLDEKFKGNKRRYLVQCILATVSVLAVLLILDVISDTAVIAVLGASSFIVFTCPRHRPRDRGS